MEKIVIDKDSCMGCGMCVAEHPEYLIFDEMGQAEPVDKEVEPADKARLLDSVEKCPTQAFRIEDIKEENHE